MYLKELTLRGFKSFASATTLRFEPGITAVVGPNGSGKSNIVDALTWVMGEQGAKNLRGTSMEDVIFAGTSSRPPLGRAQVSLTIDNTDHTLNIDYSEVTISRTIFRNGGSEYAINGSACRLLDIQELLSDTGLGQQMHVIVGQGRLDAILRADPSGHRAFIEEAAGILKHRKRKERALRKLANTETNLSRLDDLLSEIRRQLGPLGRQARISRRADSIQVTLRDAQSRLYADDAVAAMAKRDAVRGELASVRHDLQAAQSELARVKVRIEQIESLSAQSSPALARINQTWHEMSQIQERLKSLSSLAGERGRSLLGQLVTSLGEDPDMLNKRAEELESQARRQSETVNDMRITLDKAIQERADDEKKLASVRQTLAELRKSAQQRDLQIANLNALIAREEAAAELADTRAKDFTAQRETLQTQLSQARSQCESLEREADNGDDDGGKALEQARADLAKRQEALDDALARQRDIDGSIITLQAKADALRDTLESRNASGALEQDDQVAAMGRLADFIHVEEGWEEAIAHALDAFSGAIVVPGERNLLHALRKAKQDRLGKAVLVMSDVAESGAGAPEQVAAAEENDGSPYRTPCAAGTMVSANPDAPNPGRAAGVVGAVRLLLNDVVAVETMDEAVRMVHDGGWAQAITRDGEVVNPVGAVGGSSLSQSDLSLAARRDKALKRITVLQGQLDDITRQVGEARQRRDQGRVLVDKESQRRIQAKLKSEQAAKALQSAESRMKGVERQVAAIEEKLRGSVEERRSHQLKLDDLRRALAAIRDSGAEHADVDELGEREHRLEAALNATREHEVTAKIAWTEAERKVESFKRQAGLLRDNAAEATQRRARIEAMNERRKAQAAHAQRIADDAAQVASLVAASIDDVIAKREALQAEASNHDAELKTLRAQRDGIEPKVAGLQRREHELDVDRERLAGEFGQLTQKVSDDLGLSIDELTRDFGPERPVPVLDENGRPVPRADASEPESESEPGSESDGGDDQSRFETVPYDRAEQRKRLEKAKRDLAALGKVNPLAGEEYDALETRNQYLNDQRNDVVKSRDDLMKLIRDLDSTMVSVFKSAFDDTAAAFEKMFATLFPGGTGRLRLDDPDDLLATGVIVEASPAGKRVKQLSLLSGGERSLTALALLFAIFTARPSPFYVMDEVEAALDDVNLTRLINAFNELREHAQLIIITHQQRTMSIADALYGITMRSDGVTAVVSQKLSR